MPGLKLIWLKLIGLKLIGLGLTGRRPGSGIALPAGRRARVGRPRPGRAHRAAGTAVATVAGKLDVLVRFVVGAEVTI